MAPELEPEDPVPEEVEELVAPELELEDPIPEEVEEPDELPEPQS